MRRLFYRAIIILASTLTPLIFSGLAQAFTGAQLIENASAYDNQVVVYQGEAIGDVMIRGDFAWVNLNDGAHTLGVWMPKNLTKDIFYTGSYKTRGDQLEVRGIFNRACSQHGGDMDIHAQIVKKIQAGGLISEDLDKNKINLSFILAGVLCLVLILSLLRKK